ncbi:MAG: SurA N-terminal domain-containing protein, partial [Terriglobales bacterium]
MKKHNYVGLAALVLISAFLMLGLAACNRNSAGGDVMASINGRKIYRSEVDKYYANQTAGSDQQPTGEQAVSLRLSILNELIETEILMQRAEKLGLLATDEEVDRKLNEIKSPYTAEEFNKRLQDKKISLDDFKRDLRRSLTRDKVLNKEITSRINITDQDVTSYFNQHKAEFNLIEAQYHLA